MKLVSCQGMSPHVRLRDFLLVLEKRELVPGKPFLCVSSGVYYGRGCGEPHASRVCALYARRFPFGLGGAKTRIRGADREMWSRTGTSVSPETLVAGLKLPLPAPLT